MLDLKQSTNQSLLLLLVAALPAVNLELATRNYLGGALAWRAVKSSVENAERKPSAPSVSVSRLSLGAQLDAFHGAAVDDFIVTECRNLGLWSGLRPDNVKVAQTQGKCRMM